MLMAVFGSCYVNTDSWVLTVDTALRVDEREQDWDEAISFCSTNGYEPFCDDPYSSVDGFDRYQLVTTAVAREITLATPIIVPEGETVS